MQGTGVEPVEQETIAKLMEMEIKDKPADMESTRLAEVTMVDSTVQKTKEDMAEVDEPTTLVLAAQKTMARPVDKGLAMPF